MTTEPALPRIALTPGEPAGIGPDIVIQALQRDIPAELVVIADPELMLQRARQLGLSLQLDEFDPKTTTGSHRAGQINILPIKQSHPSQPGKTDPANAAYVLQTLEAACRGCLEGRFAAMVTAPVHKAVINQAGYPFTGHTEYLAELCGRGWPVMMLANRQLRVALMTTHLPLSRVSQAITTELVEKVIRIIWHDLKERFGLAEPRILVCGLNPHAGEDGHLGTEEIDIIIPALDRCRRDGIQLSGPLPADTAFRPDSLQAIDVVVAMYHDQGLPVLKAQGFGEIVNITLGLPILRTSVDHGTALNLAGTGKASCSSLLAAIDCAITLAQQQSRPHRAKTPRPGRSANTG